MIQLIGPGGAGKSTVGAPLAECLGISFLDLDVHLSRQIGDIGDYIDRCGYDAYAHANLAEYCSILRREPLPGVIALSSGFMTYPSDIHPEYSRVRGDIERSATTFVLLPSTECEACVAETVRRQVGRAFGRSAAKEEEVIRRRFTLYLSLGAPKVETMRSLPNVIDDIVALMASRKP